MFRRRFQNKIEGITLVYKIQRQKEDGTYSLTVTEKRNGLHQRTVFAKTAQSRKNAAAIAKYLCQNAVMSAHIEDVLAEKFGITAFALSHETIKP